MLRAFLVRLLPPGTRPRWRISFTYPGYWKANYEQFIDGGTGVGKTRSVTPLLMGSARAESFIELIVMCRLQELQLDGQRETSL